jgi:outer membrane receptor protein involved in Fe transport
MNYQLKYVVQPSPKGTKFDYSGKINGGATSGNQFRYRISTTANYRTGPAAIGLRWRYFPSAKDASLVVNPTSTILGVPSHHEFDLFGSWNIGRTLTLRGGIDNLLNTKPEVSGRNVSTSSPNSSLGTTLLDYDVLGRRFFAGLTARF